MEQIAFESKPNERRRKNDRSERMWRRSRGKFDSIRICYQSWQFCLCDFNFMASTVHFASHCIVFSVRLWLNNLFCSNWRNLFQIFSSRFSIRVRNNSLPAFPIWIDFLSSVGYKSKKHSIWAENWRKKMYSKDDYGHLEYFVSVISLIAFSFRSLLLAGWWMNCRRIDAQNKDRRRHCKALHATQVKWSGKKWWKAKIVCNKFHPMDSVSLAVASRAGKKWTSRSTVSDKYCSLRTND